MRAEELSRLWCGLYSAVGGYHWPSKFIHSIFTFFLSHTSYFSHSSSSSLYFVQSYSFDMIYPYLTTVWLSSFFSLFLFFIASWSLIVLILLQPFSCFTFLIQVILNLPISPFAFRYQDIGYLHECKINPPPQGILVSNFPFPSPLRVACCPLNVSSLLTSLIFISRTQPFQFSTNKGYQQGVII